ncbi:sulfotransferase family protein [Seongchinamella sediminis]|uniref:Sulfotransferase family protein n=2 Tax=Seongchinamella sediminis TaxID=2283635 RepID=A0A3L7E423_9GAMM|nr:sulfotransferase family protein [Seongchinamella sediminis]
MSLKFALEQLGYPCYHMVECFPKGPEHWRHWEQVGSGRPDWDAIFDGFTATVDFPTCTSYAALAAHYPDAKVVLTVRDPEKWFTSVQDTIFGKEWIEFLPGSEAGAFTTATINNYFDGRMHDHDYLVRRFDEHVAEVRATISPERLLVFEVADGWEPLCDFLGLPAPGGAFPHINDTEAVQGIIATIMDKGFQAALGYKG